MSEEYKEYEAAAGDSEASTDKKTSPWVWVAVGCGGIIVLAALAFVAIVGLGFFVAKDYVEDFEENPARAMAELAIRQDPDLEIIDSDDETFTIRDRSTGQETTVNFEDIAEGKLSFRTEEGEVTVESSPEEEGGGITLTGPEGQVRLGAGASAEDVPDWVPLFPDATETAGTFQMEAEEGLSGIVSQVTDADVEDVLDWFKDWLDDHGYELAGQNLTSSPAGTFATVMGERAEEGRSLNITVAETDEGTSVTVSYTEGG